MLATATTESEVRAACASPQKTYDVLFHIKLRQRYTAIWWCNGDVARDESKEYMRYGGHSGHALFVKGLHMEDHYAPLPRGPPSKRKCRNKQEQISDVLKRMLQAPQGEAASDQLPQSQEVAFAATHQRAPPHCKARTAKGRCCTLPCFSENLCRAHRRIYGSEKQSERMQQLFTSSVSFRLAAQAIERRHMAQALHASLEENSEQKERMQIAQGLVYSRLLSRGMRAIPTLAEGDCFFIALVKTAELPTTPFQLRQEVCDYLESCKDWFAPCFEHASALSDHILRERNPGKWATAFEICAASHLLCRPMHLVTDHGDTAHSTALIEPPSFFAASIWGATVYLAHFLEWHFEGTTAA